MTVKEMIKLLWHQPEDAEVSILFEDNSGALIHDVAFNKTHGCVIIYGEQYGQD